MLRGKLYHAAIIAIMLLLTLLQKASSQYLLRKPNIYKGNITRLSPLIGFAICQLHL